MVNSNFFDYQWYPRVIKRLTTVIFSNFFRPELSKTVYLFLFLLFFNLKRKKIKEKVKNLTVLDNFRRKKLENITVVRRSITQEYH